MPTDRPELDDPPSRVMKPVRRQARRPEGTMPEVPDHEILRIIGTGAYGEVWLARSVTGAYRAVKVVWREDFDDERTFIREFEGILNYEPIARGNPGLVHILHVGRHQGEFPYYYYVMELADDAYTGIHIEPADYLPRTLRSDMQLYGHHAMPLDYVLEVGSQLAHALAGLHAEELTHRDVKPSNVVFVNSRAKLADAGLVAHNSKRSFVGTEGYIPPDGPGTPRADVYALAKVLYEMGTGKDRLDFPELPAEMPEGATHRRWLEFNEIICAAADPQVRKTSIVTAQALAERLDALRNYAPARRARRKSVLFWLRLNRRRVMMGTLALGFVLAVASHFLPADMRLRISRAAAALAGQEPPQDMARQAPLPPAAPPPAEPADPSRTGERPARPPENRKETDEPQESQLFIATVPSGASIYTEDGVYVDETPYGPVAVEPGRRMSFILRKEGYADTRRSGVVPEYGLLMLGGELTPYHPPRSGQPWKDAQGTPYAPEGTTHEAESAVTRAMFQEFLDDGPAAAGLKYEEVPGTELIRTTQEGISAFTLWLTRQCETLGTIGRDHCLVANPEPGTSDGEDMCAYRLSTIQVQKTPITVYSNPPGASVIHNGRLLGVTPMQGVRVPVSPYLLEVRLPGYSTVRKSGLSPKGLSLDLVLQPNNSVTFGSEWINGLGLKFMPFSPDVMAGATEVRVSDFKAYCAETRVPEPEPPDFEQNEHHPVVNVSRVDAENFARWLTAHDRKLGLIEATDFYRLPTDEEWSAMVGLQAEKGNSPYERRRRHSSAAEQDFPWGMRWPPVRDTGNYADVSAIPHTPPNRIIPNYRDGFPYTAPVGSYPANALGLHDMGGNVQEWVAGEYGGPEGFAFRHYGLTRGGDYTSFRPNQLNSACRTPRPIDGRHPNVGFRLMLERKGRGF